MLTEKTYIYWIRRRYILFHDKRHSKDMGSAEINYSLRLNHKQKHHTPHLTMSANL